MQHDDDHTPPAPGGPDDETREAGTVGDPEDEAREAGPAAPQGRAAPDVAAADPTLLHAEATAADGPRSPADAEPGLLRSTSDRLLFGVCGGIAERYGFEPLLVRLAFLLTLFLGGAGIVFYLAAAFLIPAAPASHAAAPPARGAVGAAGGVLRLLVGLAVAIAVLCALCAVGAVGFGATVFFGAWPVAVVLLVLGVLLLVAGRSRRTTGSLLVVALALAVPATAAVVADVRIDRSAGHQEATPVSLARAAQGYELGMGRIVLDLRHLDLRRDTRLTVPARVDVGSLQVVLPRTRCVAWTVRTEIGVGGRSEVLGDERIRNDWLTTDGARRTVTIDAPTRSAGGRKERPHVTLDLRVGAGEIIVANSRRALEGWGRPSGGRPTGGDDVLRTDACGTRSRERDAR